MVTIDQQYDNHKVRVELMVLVKINAQLGTYKLTIFTVYGPVTMGNC